jgi:uncharacterized coiled-coil protein SlyX
LIDVQKEICALEKRIMALESKIEAPHAKLATLELSVAGAHEAIDLLAKMLGETIAKFGRTPR